MNGTEVLRIVDAIHRDKNIDKDIVFEGIEQAILSAARKHFSEEAELIVDIDRESGEPSLKCDGELLDSELLGDLLGRVSAQTAKQVMIQRIREAERDSLFDEYSDLKAQLVSGTITRIEHGSAIVNLGKVEAFLPRSEQIPGESHRVNERVRAVVMDVRKAGSRVKIILSRNHPEFVRRLFEVEIPEVADRVIEVRSLAREAGYRSKVAVSCYDTKIDAVGACVGVRGARIKGIVDELAGERIDIVRWNDSLQVLVPNALQPAEVDDVILCQMLGKVIVLVRDDQLSLSIGKKGQNVRLASKLVGWDINVMTQETLDEKLDKAIEEFSVVPGISSELAENLVSQGFFTFDDLSVIEPDHLAEMGELSAEQCDEIIEFADRESIRIEEEERIAAEEARRQRREQEAIDALQPPAQATPSPEPIAATDSESPSEGSSEAAPVEAPADVEETSTEPDESTADESEAEGSSPDESEAPVADVAAVEVSEHSSDDAGAGVTDESAESNADEAEDEAVEAAVVEPAEADDQE